MKKDRKKPQANTRKWERRLSGARTASQRSYCRKMLRLCREEA